VDEYGFVIDSAAVAASGRVERVGAETRGECARGTVLVQGEGDGGA
jgi:hypothetical protein